MRGDETRAERTRPPSHRPVVPLSKNSGPAWDDTPLVLVDSDRLRAISSAAARVGVRSGMRTVEARARCADLRLLPWDDLAIAQAITEVTAALLVASPQVTPAAGEPGLWWVGANGLAALGGERVLGRALAAVAERWHPRARVAIADSCVASRAATWGTGRRARAVIVPTGGDAAYLAPAPLALIPMDAELRTTLLALGIRTAGAFAALHGEDVERRWGAEGLAPWRLARGEDARRPVLAMVATPHAVEAELASPTTTMEPILFLVRAALDRIATALAAAGRAAATLAVTLTLDGARSALPTTATAHTVTREVRLPRPAARASVLFDHCRALLDQWPLTAPACGVRVAVVATARTSSEQGDLLAAGWRDPAAATAAFARLRAELGPDAVVRPVVRDAHRVEHTGAWVDIEAPAEPRARAEAPAAVLEQAVLRLLEEPEPVTLEWDGDRPCALWWHGRRVAIAEASGPEHLSGDWWKDGYQRAYWRCTSELGELLVFGEHGEWRVHGWYD